jgi:hypothetical protein
MAGGEIEPVAERRRRKVALDALSKDRPLSRLDWRNSPATSEEAAELEGEHRHDPDDDPWSVTDSDPAGLYFDDRSRA